MSTNQALPDAKGVGCDIDPSDAVDAALVQLGHPRPTDWHQGVEPDALNKAVDIDYRRFLINRYWRTKLGVVPNVDTRAARYCLVDEGPLATWIQLFTESAAPLIVQHGLPAAIH